MKKPLLVALLLLGLASPTFAANRTNAEVFRDVSAQVNQYAFFTIFDSVHASVDAGQVTLIGKVTMPYKASDIEKRIAKVDGVTGVRNDITVLPVSQYDDSLRWSIARAIYTHPALSLYGLGRYPSIHVIVENGRVTLDGVVNNDADKVHANMIAGSSWAFEVKNELKTNDEMEQLIAKL